MTTDKNMYYHKSNEDAYHWHRDCTQNDYVGPSSGEWVAYRGYSLMSESVEDSQPGVNLKPCIECKSLDK